MKGAHGDCVPLADQDTASWAHALVYEAETLLSRASRIGATDRYQLEAIIQSAHVVCRRIGRADRAAIVGLVIDFGQPSDFNFGAGD